MFVVPIRATTMREALKLMAKAEKYADATEMWLDHIVDLNIKKLCEKREKPMIVVNKTLKEKGKWEAAEQERIEILEEAGRYGVEYIDVGIETDLELVKKLIKNQRKSKIIISYHNFANTPSFRKLKHIIKRIEKCNPDIIKIATTARKIEDNLTILNLLDDLRRAHKKAVVLCMGHKGQLSRIFAPMLGSMITYAPLASEQNSASGQLTLNDLHKIWNIIGWGKN